MRNFPQLTFVDLPAFMQGAGLEDNAEDRGYLLEIVEIFLATIPASFEQLQAAIERADLPEIKSLAHSLKGTMPTFGAMRLGEICVMLDEAAKANDLAATQHLLPSLRLEFSGVLGDMRRLHRAAEVA